VLGRLSARPDAPSSGFPLSASSRRVSPGPRPRPGMSSPRSSTTHRFAGEVTSPSRAKLETAALTRRQTFPDRVLAVGDLTRVIPEHEPPGLRYPPASSTAKSAKSVTVARRYRVAHRERAANTHEPATRVKHPREPQARFAARASSPRQHLLGADIANPFPLSTESNKVDAGTRTSVLSRISNDERSLRRVPLLRCMPALSQRTPRRICCLRWPT